MTTLDGAGRRRFLRDAAAACCGALVGTGGVLAARGSRRDESGAERSVDTRQPGLPGNDADARRTTGDPVAVSHVLSLAALDRAARRAAGSGVSIAESAAHLDGMTVVRGWMREGDDVLMLGSRDDRWPALALSDLVVALRSAFQTSALFQQAPGCSIDPRRGEPDPWALQEVRVFGMPFDCGMAGRFVAVDYEMKQAAAGIVSIDGVPSICDLARRDFAACHVADGQSPPARELTHRFWFCASYPDSPRFALDEGCNLVERPVGVQVLTEEEFFDARGARLGAGPPSADAGTFAAALSARLAAPDARYAAIVRDFRLIEAAKLLRRYDGRAQVMTFLLEASPVLRVPVARYVAGVRREEQVAMTCGGVVSEREEAGRRIIQARAMTFARRYRFDGGVTADVDLPDGQPVAPMSPATAELRRRIRAARPAGDVVGWAIA